MQNLDSTSLLSSATFTRNAHDASTHPIYRALADGEPIFGDTLGAREFVMRNGQPFEPALLPKGVRRRKPGNCYANCANFVLAERPAFKDMQYVEGFAMRPANGVLVHHAWLGRDAEALDVTWRDLSGGNNQDCLYFGVVFPLLAVATILSARGYHGLLDPVDRLVTTHFAGELETIRNAA